MQYITVKLDALYMALQGYFYDSLAFPRRSCILSALPNGRGCRDAVSKVSSTLLIKKISTVLLAIIFAASGATIAHAATAPNVWWPAQSAQLDGTQPFKAVLDGKNLSDYQIYWSVDGGNPVLMNDSQTDYPHKEALVDLTSWNWSSNGAYSVAFIARDMSGNEIGRTTVVIKHGAPAPASIATLAPTLPTNPTAPVTTTETARLAIQVWWPTANANVSGVQTVKAVLGSNLSAYRMYWSVDGGNQNLMTDSSATAPHKESVIDFGGWRWKSDGKYTLNFVAKDLKGNIVGTADVPVSVTTVISTTNAPTKLFVDADNPATRQAADWATSRPTDAAVMARIGSTPTAIWLGGWNANVQSDVARNMSAAASQSAVPTFVAYNIPGRDCGSYSAGGASDSSSYISWIKQVSAGLSSGKAILVLEPDGLANIDCMSSVQQADRYSMISSALDIFKANNPGTRVYLDAGNSGWIDSTTMAGRLNKAGVSKSAGFALNVSNFYTTAENTDYGQRVSALTNGAHFVIDTSRNGNGSNGGQWCNPAGMALGHTPTLSTGTALEDALLWIKQPGESDGACGGGPAAGGWWADYALGLARAANW